MSWTRAIAVREEPCGSPPPRAPESAAQLLYRVQHLWLKLRTATPAEEPFIERDIRAAADRYRACLGPEALTPCSR